MRIEYDYDYGKLIFEADIEAENRLIKKWYKQIIKQLERCNFDEKTEGDTA